MERASHDVNGASGANPDGLAHRRSERHCPGPANIVYALEGGHTRFILPDGKVKDADLKAGEVVWSDGGPHIQETITDTHIIQVELKQAKR